ncbi:NB-ARC domain-containing protein [Streptomyces sp. NPDC057253]|uniref:NB-ARC domain-containing protein n=1 Tax=Streptomyces sp. NPDC057253 TaxID=3346069 RepID=UPI003639D828
MDPTSPEVVRDLAERLREIMFAAGYRTATHLAQDSGVTLSTLSDALSGRRVPSTETLKRIIQTCGLPYNSEWVSRQEKAKNAEAGWRVNQRKNNTTKDPAGTHRHSSITAIERSPINPASNSLEPPIGNLPSQIRGRKTIIERLSHSLAELPDEVQVLHGMGGCGKTTLALSVAKETRARGYEVYWVKATKQNFGSAMRQLARTLGASREEIEEAWQTLGSGPDFIWRLLHASLTPWVLVFDDVDEAGLVSRPGGNPGDGTGWIRPSRSGLTIVTTRLSDSDIWGNIARCHPVEELSSIDGADILLDLAANAGSREDAQQLASRLGGLPLALRLAGSYLGRTSRGPGLLNRGQGRTRNFTSYLAALRDTGINFLDRGSQGRLDNSETEELHRQLISRTWEISLDLLEAQGFPEARTFMRMLSCFSVEPIPVDILDIDALIQHGAFPLGLTVDRLELVIQALNTLSLLEISEATYGSPDSQPHITVHKLVLEINKLHLSNADTSAISAIARTTVELIEKAAQRDPEDLENQYWWSLLHPHIMRLVREPLPDKEAVEALIRSGLRNFSYMSFTVRSNIEELAKPLKVLAAELSEDHPLHLAVRHRYALACLTGTAQLMEFQSTYKTQLRLFGALDPETLMSHYNWAAELDEAGRHKEAEREFRKTLSGRQQALGADNPYTLMTHVSLAQCIEEQKGGEKRADSEWGALHGVVSTVQSLDQVGLFVLHHLAHWLDSKERYEEAEALYRKIIGILDHIPTEGQSLCDSMRQCLATNLRKQGRPADSAETLHDAIHALARERDQDDDELLTIRHEYADLLEELGNSEAAEVTIREVLDLRLAKADASNDQRVLVELHCLTHVLLQEGSRHEEAVDTAKRIFQFGQDALKNWCRVPELRKNLQCISYILTQHGDFSEAVITLKALMETSEDGSREYFSLRRRLALTSYADGSLTGPSCREELQAIANSQSEKLGKGHDDVRRTLDALTGLRA